MEDKNYYGEEGCCLDCPDCYEDFWCQSCLCHDCKWYELLSIDYNNVQEGRCNFFQNAYARIEDITWRTKTEKAYLFIWNEKDSFWCPKSIIESYEKKVLIIPMWFLKNNDLLEDLEFSILGV